MTQDYGFRLYNPAIAKFLSVDPLAPEYPWYTPYQFAGNKPIEFIDRDGLEEAKPKVGVNYSDAAKGYSTAHRQNMSAAGAIGRAKGDNTPIQFGRSPDFYLSGAGLQASVVSEYQNKDITMLTVVRGKSIGTYTFTSVGSGNVTGSVSTDGYTFYGYGWFQNLDKSTIDVFQGSAVTFGASSGWKLAAGTSVSYSKEIGINNIDISFKDPTNVLTVTDKFTYSISAGFSLPVTISWGTSYTADVPRSSVAKANPIVRENSTTFKQGQLVGRTSGHNKPASNKNNNAPIFQKMPDKRVADLTEFMKGL